MNITVLMPAFNAQNFVSEAIESILKQSYKDFEFIIINDGSTDATLDILKKYENLDPRIRVLNQENLGISKSLNRGLQEAQCDWVAIMNADDIALPMRLEKQVNAIKNNPKVIVWGAYAYHISEKGKVLSLSRAGATTEDQFNKMMRNGEIICVLNPTAFLKKEYVLNIGGYNPMFDVCEDLEMFNRLADLGPILALPEPLVLYRLHNSSISMQLFFEQITYTRFVQSRQQAKAKSKSLPTLDEFIRDYERADPLIKFRRKIEDLSHFYYRKFGVMVSNEHYFKGILYFILSSFLNPKYSLPRAWQQRFSKAARESLMHTPKLR